MLRAALAILLFAIAAMPALAERRVALVIGNAAYLNAAPLKNPANDAADVAAALAKLGFEVVEGRDLDSQAMRKTVKQFADKLPGADVALFFYAGHAVQVGGENYLAPVDADLEKESDLDFETVSLDLVRRQMEREATTQLVFLDACRDNPLSRRFVSASRSAAEGKGLARLETSAEGTFIAFATQPDNVALDGDGRNSPFTAALLRNIHRKGVEISALMTDVRRDVYEATKQRQLPWTNSSLLGAFYFAPGEPDEAAAADAKRAAKLEALAVEAETYEAAVKAGDPKALEAYLQAYPAGIYAPLARQALARDAKPENKVASLEQKPAARTEAAPEAVAPAPAALSREAVRSIQEELRRAGCNPGRPDGLWGDNSRKALRQFADRAKLDLASLEPVEGLLESLQKHEGEICPAPAARPAEKPVEKPAKASKPEPKAQPKAAAKPQVKPERPAAKAPEPRKKTVTKTASAPKPKTKSAGACFRFNGQLICE